MRTRTFSNLPGESSPNPISSNPKRRNHRRSKQPFILEKSPVDTMADQRTMANVGNKMHKAFPLLEESSHWQYNFPLPVEGVPTARRMEIPLLKSLHYYDEETASQRKLTVSLRRWLMSCP
nr:hypothetical protein [Tanacetum cinerariifolium]